MAAKRDVVPRLEGLGLSGGRHALRLVGMSPSTLRYQPHDDNNDALRKRPKALGEPHRHHGYRTLHNQLRIERWPIKLRGASLLYCLKGPAVRKCRNTKLLVPERQPLNRPLYPNEVWSMDFVFN